MREIGGYFERDPGKGKDSLPEGVCFNSGRSALRHIVRRLGIKSIHVPYYTCPVVWQALRQESCELQFYEVGLDLKPKKQFPSADFILYTNYFGCCGRIVDELAADYANLIVDCAQAYYATPKGRADFSSPRKFFGVPEGGIAYGVDMDDEGREYPLDDCIGRTEYLDLRARGETDKGYVAFRKAESALDSAGIRRMSPETLQMLAHVDKERYADIRMTNFEFLDRKLDTGLRFGLSYDDVPMVYPYLTNDKDLRRRLIESKIYVATYWPGIFNCDNLNQTIIPLPIDQRYAISDMERIVEVVAC